MRRNEVDGAVLCYLEKGIYSEIKSIRQHITSYENLEMLHLLNENDFEGRMIALKKAIKWYQDNAAPLFYRDNLEKMKKAMTELELELSEKLNTAS